MNIMEQLARYFAAKLGLPFEGNADAGAAVFFGSMPMEPVKAVCVYAGDLRSSGDLDGVRVRVVIRSDEDGAWPLRIAGDILELLDERRDLLFWAEGDYVSRVETERGFEFTGLSDGGAQFYAADFRIYACG